MTNSMSPEEIAEMSEDHQCSCKELEQLRADISEAYYLRDKAEGRFCTALGTIEQLHAAVKTAQELAATRLMEIERLQSNEREHIQEITELTQNRDDYKADYLRMHKMFMDLKYPDTVPAHEPRACTSRESDWCCTHCGRDNDPTESHCVHCEWSRKHTVAGVLHERGCEDNPCRCGALKSPGASRDASSEFVCPKHGPVQQLTDSGDCPMCYQDRHAQRT